MTPLVNKHYLLERFPGKGGWTFARIPEILQDKKAHFGWVKVRGTIDGFEIRKYHLMPMGNGNLFLQVKAEIRKNNSREKGEPHNLSHINIFCINNYKCGSNPMRNYNDGNPGIFAVKI